MTKDLINECVKMECPICLGEIELEFSPNCGHNACAHCLHSWHITGKNDKCVVCRKKVKTLAPQRHRWDGVELDESTRSMIEVLCDYPDGPEVVQVEEPTPDELYYANCKGFMFWKENHVMSFVVESGHLSTGFKRDLSSYAGHIEKFLRGGDKIANVEHRDGINGYDPVIPSPFENLASEIIRNGWQVFQIPYVPYVPPPLWPAMDIRYG